MKVAIHQPNHWPYMGFMDKMRSADIFIVYDVAQFAKEDFHHRNRIRNSSAEGYKWLTVPVNKRPIPIHDILIDNSRIQGKRPWAEYHRLIIDDCYANAPYYREHEQFLDDLYSRKWERLIDMNMAIIDYLRGVMGIDTRIVMSSELKCIREHQGSDAHNVDAGAQGGDQHYLKNLRATKRLVDMCMEVGADTYISGAGGRGYLVEQLFKDNGIKVQYQDFHHPVYRQCFSPFIPNLSALDYIMNVDQKSIASGVATCLVY